MLLILKDQARLTPNTLTKGAGPPRSQSKSVECYRCPAHQLTRCSSSDSALTQELSHPRGKHSGPNSEIQQVHTVTGHKKHRRGPKALITVRLDQPHGQTNSSTTERLHGRIWKQTTKRREEQQGGKEAGRPGEELRAGSRANGHRCQPCNR
ncbi:Os02g0497150 [Oryza sativa Japonica Group]|uniref:Os02g0497150 protein n=1 Tax=Oryza sativa subsp. japonica TaxID=39947 RepID=A0A0N7KFB8_ORYSJ|nr:Os02g0497150 [Oryza sativa Japonica Group]